MLTHITLIIAHSRPLLCLLLRNIFGSRPGICVVAIVADASTLLKAITMHQPDVIVADISLPGMRRLPQLPALMQQAKPVKIIFSWHYRHEHLVRKMMKDSASFIVEDASVSAYFAAIKEVAKGKAYHCPQTEKLAGLHNNNGSIVTSLQKLSEKHMLVLRCALNNYTIQETAIATRLKESTVKTYRKRLKKLIGSYSYAAIENVLKKLVNSK